jgi:hypothetical protein
MSHTVVFDTTAAAAYIRQSVSVGEMLAMIASDGDTVVLPAVCLAEAAADAVGEEINLLRVLGGLPGMIVSPFFPSAAIEVGEHARTVGGLGLAAAAHEAVIREAFFVTTDAKAARRALPPHWDIVEV